MLLYSLNLMDNIVSMQHKILTCLFVLIYFGSNAAEKPLQAIMQSASFKAGSDSSYIETGITVLGNTLKFTETKHGTFQTSVSITILYSLDSMNHFYTKYVLTSPETIDTSGNGFNLVDLKKVKVPNGVYTIQVLISDNDNSRSITLTEKINAVFNNADLQLSDLQWQESYEAGNANSVYYKAGYIMHPHCISYFPTSMHKLIFYCELYNADKIFGTDNFLVSYSVMSANTGKVVNNLAASKKYSPAEALILFSEFDISDIPSGNYILQIEIKNKMNKVVLSKQEFFQRNNKKFILDLTNIAVINTSKTFVETIDPDSLNFYLEALMPTAEYYERDYINSVLSKQDTAFMKQFFYNFWQKRNETNPELAWKQYLKMVLEVEKYYSTLIHHGFETDRGRVYLQYGPPNQIEKSTHEAGSYPYEIWHYYQLASNQTNVKFIFYDPDLVTNDYKLIHSDALGEVKDNRWQYKISDSFQNQNGVTDFDENSTRDYFGSQLDDLYNH